MTSSDAEELQDGFEIDFIITYDGQTSDEEDTQPRFGGYEFEFVDEVSDSQKCPLSTVFCRCEMPCKLWSVAIDSVKIACKGF